MKKTILLLVGFFSFSLLVSSVCFAQASKTTNFKVSATVPLATGVNIVATKITPGPPDVWGAAVTELNFNPMTFQPQFGTFLGSCFFAIDVGTIGGSGNPNINVKYVEGLNPNNNAAKGLGAKTTATFMKVTGPNNAQVEAPFTGHAAQKRLIDLVGAGETFTPAQTAGGFFRAYVGIWTGTTTPDTPANTQVFSVGDAPGTYDGTLTISATVS